MLQWIKIRIATFVERAHERQIERLSQKAQALKAELEMLNGDKPIVLSEEERARLRKAREGIDPEVLKRISVIDLDEIENGESQQNLS